MTELEKIQRAKMYIDSLAKGINPLDGSSVPEEELLNNVRISRCLFYVSDILNQVIENGIQAKKVSSKNKSDFSCDNISASVLIADENAVTAKDITEKINSFIDGDAMKKLKSSSIATWLVEAGFLEIVEQSSGKHIKIPTEQGKQAGIFTQSRTGQYGPYSVVCYSPAAQRFIYDNIDSVTFVNNRKKIKESRPAEQWTMQQDEILIKSEKSNLLIENKCLKFK